ncbi:CPBP family intramembrane glutamic endopeptidase [Planococcus shenhongbingii]|uniref:CPBP family intramembrane metalloprotease n=1 Tax=Planococcus shenhongbingii TaxID=3058398 RepID=A0ABT8NBL7_9BACL|nr:CPBP family intramembrane glutamic endopeptidase [Planococcus sp. N017]MDN7245279.1 CPBP family intramembrane metalloprotease [Planococcus sp. N017]
MKSYFDEQNLSKTHGQETQPVKNRHFLKTFFALFGLGTVGIIFLVPALIPLIESQLQTLPDAPDIPVVVLVLLSLINPLILLVAAVVVGLVTAPKTGLISHLYFQINRKADDPKKGSFKQAVPIGIMAGAGAAALVFVLDLVFQPYLPRALQMSRESRNLLNTLSGIFYGGITEELLLRWGLMSLLVWGMWKGFQRSRSAPSAAVFWIAIAISSLLFALGHFGATALAVPMTTAVWTRMMLLNGLVGIVFGWLYWRKGLEIAMISHAFFHIAMTLFIVVWFLI